MATTSITNNQKSRGRPKTAFVSKKPKTKQDGPGRPKKIKEVESIETTKTFDKPIIIEENKRKDGFILAMFLFSLCVFSASLYFSGKKQSMQETNPQTQQIEATINEEAVIEDTTPIQQTGSQENNTENTDTQIAISTSNTLVSSFYNALNSNTISEIYPNIDTRLRNTKLFNVYFSKTRLKRFLNNLTSEGVQVSEINENNTTITYKLSYTLKDGETFEEIWEIGLINKDTPQIGKMRCINTGCSTLPFFNPGKYNLK